MYLDQIYHSHFPPNVMCCSPAPYCVHLVLPVCTRVPLLEQDSLSGAVCPEENWLYLPQQPSVVNSSCCWEWNFMSSRPCTCWDFDRLDLYVSCARSHSLCEFMCITALFCCRDPLPLVLTIPLPSRMSLEGRRCGIPVSLRTGPQQSYPLHIDQLWPLYYYLL